MGFAQAHIAVHEERVEQRLRGREGARHLLRRGVGEAVRGADHEAGKGQPGIERRALEAPIAGPERHRQRGGSLGRRKGSSHPPLARQIVSALGAEMRLPYPEFDALGSGPFGARQPEHEVVIVRPEPVPEEACRHGEVDDVLVHLLELHPSEPTGKDVLSQFRA